MTEIFNTLLYHPIYNLLIFCYNIVPGNDVGIAIIIITILIKFILWPFSKQALKSQKIMQELQPKIEEIKQRLGNDKEKLAMETMKLYRENKVNPLSSCLPLLIQLPFLIAVYQAFRIGLTEEHFEILYPFVRNPEHLNPIAFGFLNMSTPNFLLALMAGLAQYVQTSMLMNKKPELKNKDAKDEAMLASMNKSMQYFMPFLTILIGMSLPAGLTFYWFLTTVLTVLQQKFLFKPVENKNSSESIVEVIPPEK